MAIDKTEQSKNILDELINEDVENAIKSSNEIFGKIFDSLMTWLKDPSTYYQSIFIFASIAISYLIFKVAKKYIPIYKGKVNKYKPYSLKWILRRSNRLIFPILVTISLPISASLSQDILGKSEVINSAERVAVVWFLWIILRAFLTNTLVRTVGIWIFFPAALLQLFGWFEPVAKRLNEIGFTLGNVEITVYTFLKAIFYVSIIIWIGKLLSKTGQGYIRNNHSLTRSTQELLVKLFEIGLYTVLFIVSLNLIGIDLTALTVFGGALGVGLGFGLQKIASNFISGIILLTEKSININNFVEMDDGAMGYVRKLGARASILETLDGKEVMVPNEDFITSRVANLTHSNTRGRIDIDFGVTYNADMDQVRDVILRAAEGCDSISQKEDGDDYAPRCYMTEFGDSSVNFKLMVWMNDISKARIRTHSDLMFAVWNALKENNIEIPFPQRDLHIRSGLDKLSK